ncbi:MAG: hypothetical protein P8J68_09040 [Arenicellaceae bacterium]|nr:hypothetical protein [Arenicellaceae bacterium]
MTAQNSATRFLPLLLIFSRSLPFITGTLLLLLGFEALPLIGNVAYAIAAYGLVIIVLLTGTHWGQQLSLGCMAPGLFIYSNNLAVLSWLAWLLLPLQYFLVFLTVPQILILAIDHSLYMQAVFGMGYECCDRSVFGSPYSKAAPEPCVQKYVRLRIGDVDNAIAIDPNPTGPTEKKDYIIFRSLITGIVIICLFLAASSL